MAEGKTPKQTKTSTRTKTKTSKKRVSIIGNKPVDKEISGIGINSISPIIVETGWLNKISIKDEGDIEVNNSWAELILLMLGSLFDNNPLTFMDNLVVNKVLSNGFDVKRKLVHHPQSSGIEYEVYKLSDSGYYVEFQKDYEAITKALKGLMKALNIDTKTTTFNISPINIAGQSKEEKLNLVYSDVYKERVSDTIDNIVRTKAELSGINIKAITIFGYRQETKSSMQALTLFIMWAYEAYGEQVLKAGKKLNTDGIGIVTAHDIDEYIGQYTIAKIGDQYLYSCDDNRTIIKFIYEIANKVGIPTSLIELEYEVFQLVN